VPSRRAGGAAGGGAGLRVRHRAVARRFVELCGEEQRGARHAVGLLARQRPAGAAQPRRAKVALSKALARAALRLLAHGPPALHHLLTQTARVAPR